MDIRFSAAFHQVRKKKNVVIETEETETCSSVSFSGSFICFGFLRPEKKMKKKKKMSRKKEDGKKKKKKKKKNEDEDEDEGSGSSSAPLLCGLVPGKGKRRKGREKKSDSGGRRPGWSFCFYSGSFNAGSCHFD